MTETVIKRPVVTPPRTAGQQDEARSTLRGELRAYALISVFLVAGWLVKDLNLTTPEHGTGYWLGIIGGSLMLSLLLAPSMEVLRTNKTRAATASWSKSSRRRLPY